MSTSYALLLGLVIFLILFIYFVFFSVSLRLEKNENKAEIGVKRESVPFRWKDLVENPVDLSQKYSDMNVFVQSYIEVQNEIGWQLKKDTGLGIPRAQNPFCDTNFRTDKIWFA